ncbi:MAG: hypothetical protein CVV50_00755 [Spirochaetae bacterium HGW-Spirochaetae-6]|nr:MAG: hypothetical protein CVV50_00755 [Spirochaetae bacterium HGW-Spirochaetae-6]
MHEDDWENKLPALAMRSATYIMLGDIENAFHDVRTMEINFDKTDNILVLPHAYHCCSLCYSWSQKDFHKALDYSLQAYKIAKSSDNLIFEYSTFFSRALAYFHLENFSQAQEAIQTGIQLSREKNIFVGIYLLYAYEVEIHLWNGELDKVLFLCSQYLENPDEVVEKLPLMLLFRARALAYYSLGRYEDSLLALKEAASIFGETHMALMGITLPYLQGYILQQSGQGGDSGSFYLEVETLLGKNPPLQVQLTHVKKLLRQLERIKSDKDSYHSSSFSLKENLQLENIIKTSQKLSSILDIDKLLTVILENTLEVTGAERGALILLQETLRPKASVFLQSSGETQAFAVPQEVISSTLRAQRGIILHSQEQLNTLHENPLFASIKSIICAPLILKEEIIGLLYLDSQLIQNLFSEEELKLLGVFTSQAAISIENAQLHTRMLRQAEIEKEIEVAKDIQLSLLPDTEQNPHYEIGAFMQSAEEVGGDFYDFFLDSPPYFGIFGDVSGHGLKSGLIMMMAEVAFNTIMASQPSRLSALSHIYQQLNSVLYKNIQQRLSIKSKAAKEYSYMYMTCKIFRFDPEGNFEIFGADYSAPFICKAVSGEIIELESKGFLLGIQTDATMGKEALSFSLEKDDLLILYSDGITEAKKFSKEVIRRDKSKNYLFGTARLYDLVIENRHLNPKDLVTLIINATRNWMHKQEDDITLTIIKKK